MFIDRNKKQDINKKRIFLELITFCQFLRHYYKLFYATAAVTKLLQLLSRMIYIPAFFPFIPRGINFGSFIFSKPLTYNFCRAHTTCIYRMSASDEYGK
jgi:hypothetical protein